MNRRLITQYFPLGDDDVDKVPVKHMTAPESDAEAPNAERHGDTDDDDEELSPPNPQASQGGQLAGVLDSLAIQREDSAGEVEPHLRP